MEVLKIAVGNYGVTRELKQNSQVSDRLTLDFKEVDPILAAVRRMARTEDFDNSEFDICEMPITTFLCAKAYGKPLTAIPVFVTRNFHHWALFYSVKSGVREPKDLEGKTVGVNRGYTVTTGLWARGVLKTEYGVDLEKIHWAATDDEHVAEFEAPSNVDYAFKGRNMVELFEEGAVAAAIGDIRTDSDDIKPLIPNAREAGFDYFRRTGIYPVNHTVVVKNSILERAPWVAADLYQAFKASKDAYVGQLGSIRDPSPADELALALSKGVDGDPFPTGVKVNAKAIDALAQFALDQHITPVKYTTEELFAEATLALD